MKNLNELKSRILTGGIYLTLRSVVAAILSLANVLIVARALGPKNYGIATVSIGIFYFLIWACRLGLNVYLVRQEELPDSRPQQVVSFYNSVGLCICSLLWLGAPLAELWTGQQEVTQALRILIPAVWLDMLGMVSIAMLERDLKFDQVGLIETYAQLANYLVSVPLVLLNWSYLGPVTGVFLQFLLQFILAYRLYPISWRWDWNWQFLKPALKYGLAYSAADWLLGLRALRVPLLVSGILGVEAAGIAGIASRLVDQLTMLRLVIRRMAISVMAKLVGDAEYTCRAVSTGMAYQSLLVGPLCALFACLSTWVIPIMFGKDWMLSAHIFPILAIGVLIGSLFDLHAAVLYAVGRNREVAIVNMWYVFATGLSCLLLIPVFGLWGYALSEITPLPVFWLLHQVFKRSFGSPNYGDPAWLTAAAIPPLLASIYFPPIISLAFFFMSYLSIFLIWPELREIPVSLLSAFRGRATA